MSISELIKKSKSFRNRDWDALCIIIFLIAPSFEKTFKDSVNSRAWFQHPTRLICLLYIYFSFFFRNNDHALRQIPDIYIHSGPILNSAGLLFRESGFNVCTLFLLCEIKLPDLITHISCLIPKDSSEKNSSFNLMFLLNNCFVNVFYHHHRLICATSVDVLSLYSSILGKLIPGSDFLQWSFFSFISSCRFHSGLT